MDRNKLKGRKNIRINKELKIQFREKNETGNHWFEDRVLDISRDGLFISTSSIFPLETTLSLRLFLEDEELPLLLEGLVRRTINDSDGEYSGVGVKIFYTTPEVKEKYENFITLQNNYGWFC